MTYIYIMQRKGNGVRLALALPSFDAEVIERAAFEKFSRSRITLTTRKRERLFKQHIKVGISRSPKKRVQQVNADIFASGRTEWLQCGPMLQARVFAFIMLYVAWSWLWRALILAVFVVGAAAVMVSCTPTPCHEIPRTLRKVEPVEVRYPLQQGGKRHCFMLMGGGFSGVEARDSTYRYLAPLQIWLGHHPEYVKDWIMRVRR